MTKLTGPNDGKKFRLTGPAPLQSTMPVACGDAGCVYNHLDWAVYGATVARGCQVNESTCVVSVSVDAPQWAVVYVRQNNDPKTLWAIWNSGKEHVTISGTIVVRDCGNTCELKPVPGVTVGAKGPKGSGGATTGASGTYEISVPKGSGYVVTPKFRQLTFTPESRRVDASRDVRGVDFRALSKCDEPIPGIPLARAAAAGNCTSTTLKCLSSTQPIPAACVVTVTDVTGNPTPPTGTVNVDIRSTLTGVRFRAPSCTLTPTPVATSSSACTINWQPKGELTRKVQYSIVASYGGDGSHATSSGHGSFTLSPAVPSPSWSSKSGKSILKRSGDYTALAAKAAALPFVAAKVPGVTNVPAWFAKGPGIQLTLATFAGLELASNIDKAYADYVDPFDRRYRVVAVPHPRRAPMVPVEGSRDRRIVRSFLNTLEQELAVTSVLGTTEDRAASAKTVADHQAYRAQERAISRYLNKLAGLVDAQRAAQVAIQQALNRMLAAAKVGPVLRPLIPSSAYRAEVESGQFTGEATQLLGRLGATPAFVAGQLDAQANAPIPGTIDMSTVIANPTMLKALRQEAAMLRAEARKVPL